MNIVIVKYAEADSYYNDVTPPGDTKGNILMTKRAYIVHHNITH